MAVTAAETELAARTDQITLASGTTTMTTTAIVTAATTITTTSDGPSSISSQNPTEGESIPWLSTSSSPIRSHVERIYNSLSATSPTPDFLQSIQREARKGGCNDKGTADPLASLAAFHAYMASPASYAMQHDQEQDLSAPITDYFISSSHNTYLTGNQLYSDATASSYTNVLLSGCRCVEIDVWDGEAVSADTSVDGSGESSSSSSDSDSEKENEPRSKNEDKPKRQHSAKGRHSRLNSISSKLNSLLGRAQPTRAKASSHEPAASDTPSQVLPRLEPMVLHGHTLTKATTFREVCEAIRDSAFVTSDLPVIVSLEVNASLEQQQAMVDIIQETWKGLLVEYTPEQEATGILPALGDLRRKILIKAKWVPQPSVSDKPAEPIEGCIDDLKSAEQRTEMMQNESSNPLSKVDTVTTSEPKKPPTILAALSKLAVYTRAMRFSDFTQPEAKIPGHVFSLSESAAKSAHESHPEVLFEHNRKFFMRVYPSMTRITSSNLDPSFCWRRGVQMAALNWQNLDEGMMLNHGMFAAGQQGWVLKPPGYRSSEVHPIVRRTLNNLSIQVFAGYGISLPPNETSEKRFRPYVRCQLHVEQSLGQQPQQQSSTAQDDALCYSVKEGCSTRTKMSSGTNPDFAGETLGFPTVSGIVDELSFVRIKIKDDELGRDSLAAWTCIRLDRLKEGYRLIQLCDCTGVGSGGVLLVRVIKEMK